MLNVFKKVFGDKYEKDLKLLRPFVDEINQEYEKIKNLSDEQLKAKTEEFKQKIQERTKETREKIEELNTHLKSDEDFDRQSVHDKLDELSEQLNEEFEEILDELLPEAYAVIKSTCERLIGKRTTGRNASVVVRERPLCHHGCGARHCHHIRLESMAIERRDLADRGIESF